MCSVNASLITRRKFSELKSNSKFLAIIAIKILTAFSIFSRIFFSPSDLCQKPFFFSGICSTFHSGRHRLSLSFRHNNCPTNIITCLLKQATLPLKRNIMPLKESIILEFIRGITRKICLSYDIILDFKSRSRF